ncbi:hypothetical protein [Ensifer adhaerens]|nr:hypothetical protein [Ensifer adhaerens]
MDGKRASAWTVRATPFFELDKFEAWGQNANNAKGESSRTDAFLFGYTLFSGGSIPMRGIKFSDGFLRPDAWVIGSLVKSGRLEVDEPAALFVVTQLGWDRIASAAIAALEL